MSTRNTQTSRIILQADAPTATRATQISRMILQAEAPTATRATQISRIIIATIPLAGGKRPLRGYGV